MSLGGAPVSMLKARVCTIPIPRYEERVGPVLSFLAPSGPCVT